MSERNFSPSIPMEVKIWPLDRLVAYSRNPRKNDQAVDRMCASIREFGFKIPCLVRGDGEVVDGHLRLEAARKLGITEIPVIRCDEWTPAQVKAFRLLVNRSVTWANWDEDLLALEIKELQGFEFNLELTGFDVPEIDNLIGGSQSGPGGVYAAARDRDYAAGGFVAAGRTSPTLRRRHPSRGGGSAARRPQTRADGD